MATTHANGITIYYELHGPPEAPVLVLNNGILMNAAGSWVPQTASFAASYRVLQYDCRGQGLSDHPDGPYSMAQHADDLAALLDVLEVPRAHVLGISYGGEVSQAFALRYRTRVASLVLADTVSEVGPELRLGVEGWKAAALSGDPDLFYLVTAPWNFSPAFMAGHAALLEAARERYRTLDLPAVARLCDAFLGVDLTSQLRDLDVPTCIIVGECDILKGPHYARILHEAVRGSQLHVLAGAGHAATWEAPAEFNRIVLEFLAARDERGLLRNAGTGVSSQAMSEGALVIRRAERRDLEDVGRLGALLLRAHHDFDRLRFMAPRATSEEGYAWFLGTQLDREDVVVLVAERAGGIVGYVYAGVEPQSWKELREEAGFIHDVYVDEEARGGGVANALVDAAARWLAERGVPRIVLWTASQNEAAQRLFDKLGFRHTMSEMTRET